MNRRHVSFGKVFKEDLSIALMMSGPAVLSSWNAFPGEWGPKLLRVVAACILMALVFSVVLASAQTWVLPRLKLPSFLLTLIAVSVAYLAVILTAIPAGILLMVSILAGVPPLSSGPIGIVRQVVNPMTVSLAFIGMVAITCFFMVSKKLGPGILWNWATGRYYRPRHEDRVFMFLDLRDSTRLGEELGDLRFSLLIQRFFEDITGPVLKTKGEVSHYIGDEAVLTWRRERGLAQGNCLRCFFLIQDEIQAQTSRYLADFGTVPSFKAGVHLGQVVATQVGEIKSEIVYHGDVLNTTSRIQSLCNEVGAELLASRELVTAIGEPAGLLFVSRGERALKGKEAPLEVLEVSRQA